jgi:hypothetical protein
MLQCACRCLRSIQRAKAGKDQPELGQGTRKTSDHGHRGSTVGEGQQGGENDHLAITLPQATPGHGKDKQLTL